MNFKISTADFDREIKKLAGDLTSTTRAAGVRALNRSANRGLKENLAQVKERSGQPLSQIKKEIHVKRATYQTPVVVWTIKGYRYSVPKPTAVMRKGPLTKTRGYKQVSKRMMGVRHRDTAGQRATKLDYIKGGSKPFIIKGQNSGRKTAVYRERGMERKVTTIQASSKQYIVKNISFPNTRQAIREDFKAELPKQLSKSKYFKR
jgi:hypothetical protein